MLVKLKSAIILTMIALLAISGYALIEKITVRPTQNNQTITFNGSLNMTDHAITDLLSLWFTSTNESYFIYNPINHTLELWVNHIKQQDWGHSTTIYGEATFLSDAFFQNIFLKGANGDTLVLNTSLEVTGDVTAQNIFSGNICYSNGTGCNFTGIINATNGKDGINGTNGIDGINGTNGIDGINGTNGYTPIKGIDYFDGINGTNGIDGINGTNGINGIDGINGTNGIDGINGTNGIDGINGTNGIDGINGTNSYNITYNVTNNITNNFTVEINETKLNQTINEISKTRQATENLTCSALSGNCTAISNNIYYQITEIKVIPSTLSNTYNFQVVDYPSLDMIDRDRIQHIGIWDISKNHALNSQVQATITGASIDESFIVQITYLINGVTQ